MITKELKRTIETATDVQMSWSHVSLLNDAFKSLNLNLKIEVEDEPFEDMGETTNGQIIKIISGKWEQVNEK